MKILDVNQFVSERMKFRPVTNAELDKAKQDIQKNPSLTPTDIGDPYDFLRNYIGKTVLDAVSKIRLLPSKNIELIIRNDDFAIFADMTCRLYLNTNMSDEFKWTYRYIGSTSTHSVKHGPFANAEETMNHFKKWLEKKYFKKHK